MSEVLLISGSPSRSSKTERLGERIAERLGERGRQTEHLRLRRLPPEPLVAADSSEEAISTAIDQVKRADGIVLATPTYKAAYSGLLKIFLDLLPQHGFAGKAVLPLATGGSFAHVLALDYALRPVAHSLGARHVVQSVFVSDTHLNIAGEAFSLHDDSAWSLADAVEQLHKALDGVPHNTVLGRPAA